MTLSNPMMQTETPSQPTLPPSAISLHGAEDDEVLAFLADGESSALEELYDRHGSNLLALARRILGSREDAEEVLQETFLHAWHRARSYDSSRASVTTWLSLILRSRAIDRLRTQQSRDRTLLNSQIKAPTPSQTRPEARQSVLASERRSRIRDAMSQLPDEQRQVLEMSFYQELSHSQIAVATGVPLGTVKTRTVLGMKKLRRALHNEVSHLM